MDTVSFVREWGAGIATGPYSTPDTFTIPAAIPIGHTLVLAGSISSSAVVEPSVTDSKGNVWTVHMYGIAASNLTRGVLATCQVTTALTTSDTITFHRNASIDRLAWLVVEYDAVLEPGLTDWTTHVTSSRFVTSAAMNVPAQGLLVSGVFLENQGRVPTADAGTTITTKYASTVGSGDRAVYGQFRSSASASSLSTSSTLNTSGMWAIGSIVLTPVSTGGGGGTGSATVIVGGNKKQIATESVIVGGQKKAVITKSVIVGGVKRPL